MTPQSVTTMMMDNNMMMANNDDGNQSSSCCEEETETTASTSTRSCSTSLSINNEGNNNGSYEYEYSSSSCSSSSSSAVKVTFASQIVVVETLHIADYTTEEVYDSFYDCYEIKSFKDDAKKIARNQTLNASKNQRDDDFIQVQQNERGTERLTRCPSTIKRMEIQKLSIEKVLNEQTLWGDLEDSDDMISETYKTVTKDAIKIAHEIGLYDQKQATSVEEAETVGDVVQQNDNITSVSSSSLLKVFPSFHHQQKQTKEQVKKTKTMTTTKVPTSVSKSSFQLQLPSSSLSSGLFRLTTTGRKGKVNTNAQRKVNVGTTRKGGKWL